MKNGTLKLWWNTDGRNKDYKINSVAEGLLLANTLAIREVDDDSIGFNAWDIEYYDEEYLKEEYGCEDGFSTLYTEYGEDMNELSSMIIDEYNFYTLTLDDIISYLKRNNVVLESSDVRLY